MPEMHEHFLVAHIDDNLGKIELFSSHDEKKAQKFYDEQMSIKCDCSIHRSFKPWLTSATFACPELRTGNERVEVYIKVDGVELDGGCDMYLPRHLQEVE